MENITTDINGFSRFTTDPKRLSDIHLMFFGIFHDPLRTQALLIHPADRVAMRRGDGWFVVNILVGLYAECTKCNIFQKTHFLFYKVPPNCSHKRIR